MGAAFRPRAAAFLPGACARVCIHVRTRVRIRPVASLPGGPTHLVVFGDGLVGAMHGPEILRFIPQGGLHVLQLGLRGGDAFRTLANLRPGFPMRKKQEPQTQ